MTKQSEMKYAKEHKMYRLGLKETEVKIPLTDKERLAAGQEMSEATHSMAEIEQRKKDVDDQLKGEIKKHQEALFDRSALLRKGYRVETKEMPCFFDPKTRERVYINLETGEEIKRSEMQKGDDQAKLDDNLKPDKKDAKRKANKKNK